MINKTSQSAINIIYTGVAGTGKTYQLQQIAEQYTETLPPTKIEELTSLLVEPLTWLNVICLVFLQQKQIGQHLLRVNEIINHPIFSAKAKQRTENNTLYSSVIGLLQKHTSQHSTTVNLKNKASQAFFDKDETGGWYLLPDAKALLTELQEKLNEYQQAILHPQQTKIERFSMVCFHQAYGYEEFVEGIRPQINTQGQMTYQIQPGAFLRLCELARQDPNHRYAMLIDEINRANVSRVFGELMSLIEPSKRVGQKNSMSVHLAYSGKLFSVPNNVDIFATMNTQDHSLSPLDMAFRRRFAFIECPPRPELLGKINLGNDQIDLTKLLIAINQRICQFLGKDNQLGHSFLLDIINIEDLAKSFAQQIIPQLEQACGQRGEILQTLLNEDFVQMAPLPTTVYPSVVNHYQINPDLSLYQGIFLQASTYQKLYECHNHI